MSGIRVTSRKALGKVESWPDDLLSSEFYQARFKKKKIAEHGMQTNTKQKCEWQSQSEKFRQNITKIKILVPVNSPFLKEKQVCLSSSFSHVSAKHNRSRAG